MPDMLDAIYDAYFLYQQLTQISINLVYICAVSFIELHTACVILLKAIC